MNNIYITNNTKRRAILFSKEMAKKFTKLYPETIFTTTNNIDEAFLLAKPPKYNSSKVYAVKKGKVEGMVFDDKVFAKLTQCKGGKGKKCKSTKEAYQYIYGKNLPKNLNNNIAIAEEQATLKNITTGAYRAYVDGSYFCDNNLMGMGYEIKKSGKNNNLMFSHSSFVKTDNKGSSTIAELISAMMAIERAIDEGLESITIMHDCLQVASYATEIPNPTDNDFPLKYHLYIKEKSKQINLSFEKVKAHSSNKGNNKVDRMIRHKKIDKFIDMI